MKPGPIVAMLVLLGLSFWVMLATSKAKDKTPGAAQLEVLIANRKLKIELRPAAESPGHYEYRFRNWDDQGDGWITDDAYQAIIMKNADLKELPWLLRFCNVSSYFNLAWVALGFAGQFVFAGRMIVQWLASEKKRQSIVPPAFWYMSLIGGLVLTTYFVWRHDPVGVLGQAMGLVVYVRNIRLLMLNRPGVQRVPNGVPASS